MGDASDGEEMPEQGEAKRARVDDGRDEEGGEQGGGSLTKKRKVALFFGYVGAGYAGFQRNPGVEAVEDVLERALHAAGGVSAHNLGDLSKLSWSRAARTDKGVSAVGQLVVEPPGIVDRINAALPANFRCFGLTRVTNGFSAKNMCDRRRYRYILPEWALLPPARGPDPSGTPSPDAEAALTALNTVLGCYVGTHSFHNFTPRCRHGDGHVKRYVLSFQALPGIRDIHGHRVAVLEVVGQSFLLNQIRKMVGAAVAVHRGVLPADYVHTALTSREGVHTPCAPEVGLYLTESMFGAYNKRWAASHAALELSQFGKQVEEFEAAHVLRHIVDTDATTSAFAGFVAMLHDDTRRQAAELEDAQTGEGQAGDDDGGEEGAEPAVAAVGAPSPASKADAAPAQTAAAPAARPKVVWRKAAPTAAPPG